MSNELVPVRVRECPDGTHPDGDHVYILPKLSLECGIAARQDIVAANTLPEDEREGALVRLWFRTFCKYGAVSWELHDAGGEVWPFDVNVLLADFDLGFEVADKADDLYRDAVMRPLLERARKTSRSGATDGSTSQRTASTGTPRRRSSRATTAGTLSQVHTA